MSTAPATPEQKVRLASNALGFAVREGLASIGDDHVTWQDLSLVREGDELVIYAGGHSLAITHEDIRAQANEIWQESRQVRAEPRAA